MAEHIPNRQLEHAAHRASPGKRPVRILAENIDIPLNVGSLFRIADALGVEALHLTGRSVMPPNPKLRKTSRATEKQVPYHYTERPLDAALSLRAGGYRILSLELTSSSIDLKDLALGGDDKICLIVGSESSGVSQPLLDASDATIHIPMAGVNSSMNVATACAIATYEIIRMLNDGR